MGSRGVSTAAALKAARLEIADAQNSNIVFMNWNLNMTPRILQCAMDYRIEIAKHARVLELHSRFGLESRHPIRLGRNPSVDKAVEGDGATPVGDFYICAKNPRSKFLLSLCISYPNAEHAQRGLRDGIISAEEHAQILEALRSKKMPPQRTRLGGEIYIHGERPPEAAQEPLRDWTHGCIAIDNEAMRDLYERVALGTPVSIKR
jgi:murein L,D-transpeptidase YafK